MFRPPRHLAAALLLSACVTGLAWHLGAKSCGGADSYGYVSQADAWLARELVVREPFIEAHHPPFSRWALAPLGWRPEVDGYAIVPMYSPGYPLMLAAAKWLGGQKAMFAVVPLFAGLLVFVTYALGRRLGRPWLGLMAATFVATSPTVLYMSMMPMSDVPSAALWSAVLVFALGNRRRSAAAAGLVATAAILTRPNLVPLAALVAAWLLVRDVTGPGWRQLPRWRAPWFGALALVGAAVNAAINARLFGSPWLSGYGDLRGYFSASHIVTNIGRYTRFLSAADTPLALVAVALVVLAPVFLRGSPRARQAAWLFAPAAIAVIATYLSYLVFDDWWYLRFMLPVWPAIAVAGAAAIAAVWQRGHWIARGAAALVAIAVVAHGVAFASRHSAFSIGHAESRYPQVARAVAGVVEPNAAIVSMQHSGSMRYYGGRVTLRWNYLETDEFDAAIAWLTESGHRPYLLLDKFEVDQIRARYSGRSAIAKLDWTPALSFFNGETFLYDLADRGREIVTTKVGAYTNRTVLPAPPAHW